ncbi:hypothetical protein Pelo_6741 [Pelomyxa schiedti]|nr:hypothetical protein Pelo_6741 [Pelomyxa schiedti]
MDRTSTTTTRSESDVVRLNVGGCVFATTRTTLTMNPASSSFFTVLLSGKFTSTMDETGAFFIDRNGKLFAPILDFMRTGKLFVPPSVSADAVYNEAEYYQIQLPDRQPPQPTRNQPKPPVIHDFVGICAYKASTYAEETQLSVQTPPTSSDLKDFMSSMPLKEVGASGIASVVTYIEAHSGWRVKSWTKPDDRCIAWLYLIKPSSSS